MGIRSRLQAYESTHGPACVAIVGAGYVASGVMQTLMHTPGMTPGIVVNRNTERAIAAIEKLGVARDAIVVSDNKDVLAAALAQKRFAVTDDHTVLTSLPVDVVIEATGALDYGCRVILEALRAGQHVVSYNAEVDSLLAWRFHREAEKSGVIYTIADGDQPGALFRLCDQVEAMGFDISLLLNCKRHLDVHQNPSSGAGYAARDTTSARMTTAFGDGTKMQIEQAVVANARQMIPARRGMHGIKTTVETLIGDLERDWQASTSSALAEEAKGHVDYTLGGDFGAGVGVVAHHPQGSHHSKALSLYKMGEGPNYFFFRPYHLVHLELPLTLAGILLDMEPLARVDFPHSTSVIAIAKKNLHSGEQLDGIGGYCAYGLIDTYENASGYLPMALVDYASLVADVSIDQAIPLAAVELDTSKTIVQEWIALTVLWQSE